MVLPPRRHILVTGASSGIGAAIAERLASDGVHLTLLGCDRRRLLKVERALGRRTEVQSFRVDFASPRALAKTMRTVVGETVRLDGLVHAAGIFVSAPFAKASEADFERVLGVNVRAVFTITKALLPKLERSGGDIIVINSTVVHRAQARTAMYAASKHALQGLVDALRCDVNERGIRVTSIFPGRTATPMQRAVHASERRPYQPERLVQPADIAALVVCALTLPDTSELVNATIRPRRPLA